MQKLSKDNHSLKIKKNLRTKLYEIIYEKELKVGF